MKVTYFKALSDNYIWLLEQDQSVIIVDPTEETQVIDYIITNNLNFKGILLTHGHGDHSGGVGALLDFKKVAVIANNNYSTTTISDHQQIILVDNIKIEVIFTPGHTSDSVCYRVIGKNSLSNLEQELLFCGDTLFLSGCGRIFTQDYFLMFEQLQKIKKLSRQTWLYPAHEYTLNNIKFAIELEENPQAITDYYKEMQQKLQKTGSTIPTQLDRELLFNPFLKTDIKSYRTYISKKYHVELNTSYECFKFLRQLKDKF